MPEVKKFELKSGKLSATVMDYGANLLTLNVPDKDGKVRDVVLGYENIDDYEGNDPGYGCSVIPFANRIGDAKFTLNGKEYTLDKNDGENNLHSGFHPLHHKTWDVAEKSDNSITFTIEKKDMECGMPGNVKVSVTYTLTDNALHLTYKAVSDADTIFNPTNHSYFNLDGHDAGPDSALSAKIMINADQFTETDDTSIPTGKLLDVSGTPMDLRTPKALKDGVDSDFHQLKLCGGYDNNYVIKKDKPTDEFGAKETLYLAASMESENSGIKMEVFTDLPGIQLYCGNYIPDKKETGKGGTLYERRGGVAFESQYYPNAINIPEFPQPVIKAGEEFVSDTVYKFSV